MAEKGSALLTVMKALLVSWVLTDRLRLAHSGETERWHATFRWPILEPARMVGS
jgi:hypothetical protein